MEWVVTSLVRGLGKPYSSVLGIDLESKREGEIFKWFLASVLFGKRIGTSIAMKTYHEFENAGLLTPEGILDAGWDRLVAILDRGGYVRYDFSTATKLLEIMKQLKKEYGSLGNLHRMARDGKDLEKRLQEFKGIGPVTTNIFLRELRTVWRKADPEPSQLVKLAARNLGINLKGFNRKTGGFIKLECALLRLGKDWCRKGKCGACKFKGFCRRQG